MSYEAWRPRCAICKQSVDLTESKADEYGRAVQENCYVSMLLSKKPPRFTVRIDAPTRAAVATVPPMGGRQLSNVFESHTAWVVRTYISFGPSTTPLPL